MSAQQKSQRILIAGAGIGGLVAALCLLREGFDVDVFEQAPELREVGAGLWLSANGIRVLAHLGLEDTLKALSIECTERMVRHWNSGRAWWLYKKESSPSTNAPYVLLRAHLHRMLMDAVEAIKPGAIRLNAKVTGFHQADGRVRLDLAGGSAEGDVLIGADGLNSKVREGIVGPMQGRFTNALAWRGLVPVERLAGHQRRPVVTTWVGPTAHVTVYPVRWRDSELLTFSGQVERADWTLESWSEKGSVEECLNDFRGWHEDVVEMIANVESLHKWGLFVRDALPRWSVGRVSLLGDACHSMVPYLGQGVNMAIEDAAVLSRCLARYSADPEEALRRYEGARRERTSRVAQGSADMQHTFHHPDLARLETAVPYIESQWSPQASRARFDWIYGYDALGAPI
ncbi:MAG TPA: FAD-dependent monooxygenase [Usitatibacter sp.]|nr:FAD-dependent monooxygenase [Usitatibacter sp.]